MFTVGLTGGVATGKSVVSQIFSDLGAAVIDADCVSRMLTETGTPILAELVERFGAEILNPDQTLNRSALKTIVWANPAKLKMLETIMHPAIRAEMFRQRDGLNPVTNPYCIMVVPLLIENQLANQYDRILVTHCPEATQLERLMQRDQITQTDAQTILSHQTTTEARLALADDILDTSDDLKILHQNVKLLHNLYIALHQSEHALSKL